jgi:CBS domain-containing protein
MRGRTLNDIVANQELLHAAPTASVLEAVKQMDARNVAAVLVMEKGKLAGIFTERDLLKRVVAKGRDPAAAKLAEAMTPDPVTVSADAHPVEAMRLMRERGFRHLPVVRGGRVVGVVSIRDFVGDEIAEFEREVDFRDALWEHTG